MVDDVFAVVESMVLAKRRVCDIVSVPSEPLSDVAVGFDVFGVKMLRFEVADTGSGESVISLDESSKIVKFV